MVCSKVVDGVLLTSRTSSSIGPQISDSAWLSLVLMSKRALYGVSAAPS